MKRGWIFLFVIGMCWSGEGGAIATTFNTEFILAQDQTIPDTFDPPDLENPDQIDLPSDPQLDQNLTPTINPTSVCILNTATSPEELIEVIPPPTELSPTNAGNQEQSIAGFRFVGNHALSDRALQKLLQEKQINPHESRNYSFSELFTVAATITEHYNEAGYINSYATIPPQTVGEDGIVTIAIVEGGIETIQLRRQNPRSRLTDSYICDRLALAMRPLNINQLLDVLRQLQLDPLIAQINAELIPGSAQQSSILTVELKEAKSFTVRAGLDNARPPSVGTDRQVLQLSEGNLLGFGDRLTVILGNTLGSLSLDASYSVPLNARNGRLIFAMGKGESKVIEDPFECLELRGDSAYWALTWQQPIARSAADEFVLDVSLNHRFSQTSILGFDFPLSEGADSEGRLRVTSLKFGQNWTHRSDRDYLGLRSQFAIGLDLFNATVNEKAPDSLFFQWQGQGVWLHRFRNQAQILVQGNVQWSDRALLAQEQFSLGGLGTVRGYRQEILSRDNGAFLSVEYQHPIFGSPEHDWGQLYLAPFVDWGIAWPDAERTDIEAQTLSSLGLGLIWNVNLGISARLYWGWPLIEVDNRNNTLQEGGLHFMIQSEVAL